MQMKIIRNYPSINCVDENLNPCKSLNISKDKSDKNIIDNNPSKEKKKKSTKKSC